MHGTRARRGAAALLLGGVAITHLMDLPHKLTEAPYMAYLFMALIAASILLALAFAHGVSFAWEAASALCVAALAGYAVSRSVALPGMADHVGDWADPLGIAAVACESAIVVLGLEQALQRVQRLVRLAL